MANTAVEYLHLDAAGAWRVIGSRVSVDSIVTAYWEGKSPEAIAEEFPSLSAEVVYGAIASYLRNKNDIDEYMKRQSSHWEQLRNESETQHGPLLDRIRSAGRPANGDST